ncbi:MAG: ribokinase [Actinobacteria bacterium]|nr:ribokinase [Actinomycetota bacterium]
MIYTRQIPAPGETVIGTRYSWAHGGKGANQASAASAAGRGAITVSMVGAVGQDDFAESELNALETADIGVGSVVRVDDAATGIAFVTVDESGANQIVVIPGANHCLTEEAVSTALIAIQPTVVVVSLEIPDDAVAAAVTTGRRLDACVVLNPAPFRRLNQRLLDQIDVLTPNEGEFRQFVGAPDDIAIDEETIPALIRDAGRISSAVLVTVGARGAILAHGAEVTHIPAPPVAVVDTTGAGDALNGSLAAGLAAGAPLREAAESAVRFAAATTTVPGARVACRQEDDV